MLILIDVRFISQWLDNQSPSRQDNIAVYRRALYFMVKLAANSGELPPSLFLEGVEIGSSRDPTYLGGFADIFRGRFQSSDVAVKRLRLFTIDAQQLHKVII
jgi:hypothetical protein